MRNLLRKVEYCVVSLTGLLFTATAFAQTPYFAPGNIVVSVEGCGVRGGNCSGIPNGTGGNNSPTGYGDNQAAPLTLFQYSVSGASSATFVNSLVLPQSPSAANVQVSGEYGSSSEATLQLSGGGQYLTLMGYGIDALSFNANGTNYGTLLNPKGADNYGALAQSGSLTLNNQTPNSSYPNGYTPVPRVLTLIDPYGNVNSSTALYNIFDFNNPRSAYTLNGSTVYVSGQGSGTDTTGGVFYSPVGAVNNSPTAITGLDSCANSGCTTPTIAQDTRTVQIYNNTLYISVDSTEGHSNNRSFIGTLGTPPATSMYVPTTPPTGDLNGPMELSGLGNTGGTGKETINTAGSGNTSNGNSLNAGLAINISPENYFFASPTVLYVADSGSPKQSSNTDTVCTNAGGTGSVGDGGLQKWILNPTVTVTLTSGSETASASSGAFSQDEIGLSISGTGIPAGTTITAVSSAGANATLSANATVSGSESVTVTGWSLAYTLYNGLGLTTNVACDPAQTTGTTGLQGLTGYVSGGVAYLFATNYTNADLDPTYLYGITDTLLTTKMVSPGTAFTLLDTAPADSNFKGVSLVPTLSNGNATITSSPSGLTVSTSGTGCVPGMYTTPVTLTWTPSSSCELSVTGTETSNGVSYYFAQWQDNTTGTNDSVTGPSTGGTVYTATFVTDVSSGVSVTGSGLVYSRGTKEYSGTVTITNTSSATISGPIQAVFSNLISGATLVNATGTVANGTYAGSPYITATSSFLAPGASVSFPIKYSYTGSSPISYTPITLSGAF